MCNAFSPSELRTGAEAHSTIDLRTSARCGFLCCQASNIALFLGLGLVATLMAARKVEASLGCFVVGKYSSSSSSAVWRQLRASQHQAAAEGRRRRAQQGRKPPRRQEPFLPNGCPALAPVKVHSPQLCHRLLNTLKNLLFLGCISIIILPPLPLLPFPSERDYVPSASSCQRTLARPAAAAGRETE